MKRIMIAIVGLSLLAGCKTTQDPELGEARSVQVPPLPASLAQRPTRLPDITDPTMGGIQIDGVKSDRTYNDVAHQTNSLITVYECVRVAVNSRDASKIKDCLGDNPE